MERRRFGRSGQDVPVIGQGTWKVDAGTRAVDALRLGLDRGLTHVDTAEMYGGAGEIVRDAIAGRRDEVFLMSKVLPDNASRRGTRTACERSLRRLGTDRFDCYGPRTRGGRVLQEIADAHGATPRQVALRFLLRHPSGFVIPRTSNPEHVSENAGAAGCA